MRPREATAWVPPSPATTEGHVWKSRTSSIGLEGEADTRSVDLNFGSNVRALYDRRWTRVKSLGLTRPARRSAGEMTARVR